MKTNPIAQPNQTGEMEMFDVKQALLAIYPEMEVLPVVHAGHFGDKPYWEVFADKSDDAKTLGIGETWTAAVLDAHKRLGVGGEEAGMIICPRGECNCHHIGLNPWIESCPMCGCVNPKFSTELTGEDRQFKEDMDTFFNNFGRL